MRPAIGAVARTPEGFEDLVAIFRSEYWSDILHFQPRGLGLACETHEDRRPGRAEVDGVVDELVEQLNDEIGCAVDRERLRGDLDGEFSLRERASVGLDGCSDHADEVEARALRVMYGFLDPRCRAHRHQNRIQALAAFASPVEIGTCRPARPTFQLQILERRAHDGKWRADFVRQFAGKSAQVAGVLLQTAEESGEATGYIAQLVGGASLWESGHQTVLRQRRFAGTAQAGEAQSQVRSQGEHRHYNDQARDE